MEHTARGAGGKMGAFKWLFDMHMIMQGMDHQAEALV